MVGKKIQKARECAGLTILDLAARVGLSVGYMIDVEGDEVVPSWRCMLKIAKALGKPPSWIMDGQSTEGISDDPGGNRYVISLCGVCDVLEADDDEDAVKRAARQYNERPGVPGARPEMIAVYRLAEDQPPCPRTLVAVLVFGLPIYPGANFRRD